jgi:glycosyltransferase involved in cell wall biosynthesis
MGAGASVEPISVAFYGYVSGWSGYGTAARAYVRALSSVGVDLSVIDLAPSQNTVTDPVIKRLLNRKITPQLHLFCAVPWMATPLTLYYRDLVIITVWETDTIPRRWREILDGVLEVWLPCDYNVSTFRRDLVTPVFKWPCPVNPWLYNIEQDYSKLPPLTDVDFVFYSIFEWQTRKNPLGLIKAFMTAFPNEQDTVLIMKTGLPPSSAVWTRMHVNEIRSITASKARVHILTDWWTQAQIDALVSRGNCYVSLHRGEGWCYPLFDAACRGTPVIATGYSGPCDYLRAEHHNLVQYDLVPVDPSFMFYEPGMKWAAPDLKHAAELMRYVYENRKIATDRAQSGRGELIARYSKEHIGSIGKRRLTQLLAPNAS